MYRARPNGSPQEVVQHLTTRCGVPIEVAERLVPNQEGIGDSPRTALTPDALERYQQVVREDYAEEPVLQAVLLLLPLTGLRVSEICHLTKKNLHRDGDKVSWTFHGKGDKERTVPLWRKARRIFDPYMEEQKPAVYLFPNKTRMGAISPATVQEACRHIAGRDESLRHLTPHVLRHTFATMALLNCHDIKRTQEILGHGKKSSIKIPVVMLRYLHPDVQENRGDLQHSKLRGAVAAKRNPEQTVLGGGSLVPAEIYEKLKSGEADTIPVPGKRNRVYVYSRRRDDVIEVSEDRARTWLALRDASREVAGQLRDATRRRAKRAPALATTPEGGILIPEPEGFSRLVPLPPSPTETPAKPKRASKAPAEPKADGKAKKNPLETPMRDDWYWKAIYSNVPPGPSRSHPVAQRNPAQEVHIAKNGTPYVYENGRPKFISKATAARMNPAGTHGAFARNNPKKVYDLYVYEGEETRFAGTFGSAKAALKVAPKGNSEIRIRYEKEGRWDADTYAYVTKQGTLDLTGNVRRNPAKAKKNNHRVWDQVIDPFSVSDEDREGLQPLARRNSNDPYRAPDVDKILTIELHTAETPFLLTWNLLQKRVESDGFVSKRIAQKGKKDLAKKASEADAIDKAKAMLETLHKRFPDAHAQIVHWPRWGNPYKLAEVSGTPKAPKKAKKNNHRVWEQIIDPFSVTEARTYGRQPIARRNPSEDKQRLLSKSTVPWSKFSKDEIQMILQDALMHGDLVLAEKAKSALNRRSSKSRRNPAGAHGAFDQVIGPFSVEEISFDGEQPYARRNARKSKAKRNGVVRVYEVK